MSDRPEQVQVLSRTEAARLLPMLEPLDGPQTPLRPQLRTTHAAYVGTCVVSRNGLGLHVHGTMESGEVLVGLDVEETPDAVRLVAQLGADPAYTPTEWQQGDGFRWRAHVGMLWCWQREVVLQRPLGTRPVLDVGTHDPRAG